MIDHALLLKMTGMEMERYGDSRDGCRPLGKDKPACFALTAC